MIHHTASRDKPAIARDAKVPVQVLNADKAAQVEIDKARTQRLDISADSYSYPQLVQDKGLGLERASRTTWEHTAQHTLQLLLDQANS